MGNVSCQGAAILLISARCALRDSAMPGLVVRFWPILLVNMMVLNDVLIFLLNYVSSSDATKLCLVPPP